ncbi:MAG: WcaF family extracellular polysaccharide biosynthesis acetyltransferase [Ginsengibacter sp.]|jgi:putative colanic acid biosynthesis acetyltransferase WcaF
MAKTTTDLSTYNNDWYQPGNIFKRGIWYLVNLLFFKSFLCPFSRLKRMLLRCFGAKIGKCVVIKPNVNIKYPWFLQIGDYTWIGENVWIDNLGMVNVGAHVCISQGAFLVGGNHDFTKTTFDLIVKPINIEDGAWIGAKSIVCGGAFCGSHCVLTVGSIVSGVLEPYSIYSGNPAVKIKERVILKT